MIMWKIDLPSAKGHTKVIQEEEKKIHAKTFKKQKGEIKRSKKKIIKN